MPTLYQSSGTQSNFFIFNLTKLNFTLQFAPSKFNCPFRRRIMAMVQDYLNNTFKHNIEAGRL